MWGGKPQQLCGYKTAGATALLWNHSVRRCKEGGGVMCWCCTMKRMMNPRVGGNYSPVLVLPSGTRSPPVWSHCWRAGIRGWNEASGGADSPTRAESSSPRPPSWSGYLPAVTSLLKPDSSRGHCGENHRRRVLTGQRNHFTILPSCHSGQEVEELRVIGDEGSLSAILAARAVYRQNIKT